MCEFLRKGRGCLNKVSDISKIKSVQLLTKKNKGTRVTSIDTALVFSRMTLTGISHKTNKNTIFFHKNVHIPIPELFFREQVYERLQRTLKIRVLVQQLIYL